MSKLKFLLKTVTLSNLLAMGFSAMVHAAPVSLFEQSSPGAVQNLPEHVASQHTVKVNRQALLASKVLISLPDEEIIAVRTHLDRKKAGTHIWTGHVQGDSAATVIITLKGMRLSGLIQWKEKVYRLSTNQSGKELMYEVDLSSLPEEEPDGVPQGDGAASSPTTTTSDSLSTSQDNVVQDLLVVYTQGACNYAGGCLQLEADIDTAVADINSAYAASGINITMNLVGTHLTDYAGTNASETLSALRSTTDGQMDEVHGIRDSLGADIVSMVYDGAGCGIGYLNSSASSAFNVTDVPCLVGNRTMAHEIGHNQGAHHDRRTVGGGTSGAYNYGFRRCSDGSIDDLGSPYFRTVMAYHCSSAPRVGRFSNPNVNYSGVPQGIDPNITPDMGAWNARTINESAVRIAGFRTTQTGTAPNPPSNLMAVEVSHDRVSLTWQDNSENESSHVIQRQSNASGWSTIATIQANETSYTDTGLQPETNYEYRVRADNSLGASDYTGVVIVLTSVLPTELKETAVTESAVNGTVSGTYTATHADDGTYQSVMESSSGGPKRSRKQAFSHIWEFDVTGGVGGVVFSANTWVSGNEGANFSLSTDFGTSWAPLFTVDSNDSNNSELAVLGDVSGRLWVRATDATQSNGELVDVLYVDKLLMSSSTSLPEKPDSPTDLMLETVTDTSVVMVFFDTATNESGFNLWRSSADPGANCSAGEVVKTLSANPSVGDVSAQDTQAAPSTSYFYWVTAFNAAGDSATCSNVLSVTTEAAQARLIAGGFKQKGVQQAQLNWTGLSGSEVNIFRNGTLVSVTSNDGEQVDNIGQKGGGSHTYQVCDTSTSSTCTNLVNLTF